MSLHLNVGEIYRYLIGGSTPTGAQSATGDLSQQIKHLNHTSPPSGNKDGTLREQVEALVVQLLESGSANALTASATGSLGQQIAQAAQGPSIINSIQYGTIASGSLGAGGTGAATATITSVSTSKSVVVNLGFAYTNGVNDGGCPSCRLALTNGTTVTANFQNSSASAGGGQITVGFCVVEFK
jgi:hypothetical protein